MNTLPIKWRAILRAPIKFSYLFVMALLTMPIFASSAHAQNVTVETLANNSPYVSRRPHASGVIAGNATHVTWSGPRYDVFVRSFNHSTGNWGASKRIRDNNFTNSIAYHNYPVMTAAPNGKLLVFYADHNNRMFQLTSPNANNTSGTWRHKEILPSSETPAYPTVATAGGDIYLFYRVTKQSIYRPIRMVKSSDNGLTWSSPRTVIDTGNVQSGNFNEVYLNDISVEPARFGHPQRLRITFHLAGGAGHNFSSRNVYMAYLNTNDDRWETVSGNGLGFVIDKGDFNNETNRKFLVRRALPTSATPQGVSARMPAQHVRSNNDRPVVISSILNSSGKRFVSSSRWNGSNWVNSTVVSSSSQNWFANDTQYVNENTVGVLVSSGSTFRYYESSNSGSSWTQIWQRDLSSLLTNGADRFSIASAISSKRGPIDFTLNTYNFDTRRTNPSFSGRMISIRH